MQQSSMSSASSRMLSHGTPPIATSVPTPMYTRFEVLISSLTDSTKRDDIRHKDLREISESFEELSSSPSCVPLVDTLIRAFIRVLQETPPQFISENNTLQLRKLILELMLRLSTSDTMKNYTKMIQVLLFRIAIDENEENALIIIKILTDQIKAFRSHFCSELVEFFSKWKNAYREMLRLASHERMFLSPDFFESNSKSIEDFGTVEALENCFITTMLSFKNLQPSHLKYSLIPRAKQSVRVLAEMTMFLLFLIQMNKQHQQHQHLLDEIVELVPLFINYVNIAVPKHIRREKSYNKELVDEFHNSQVRALTFVAYTTRHSPTTVLAIVDENASTIVNGIKQLFDGLHGDVIHQRRDLLIAIKFFFQCQCDIKAKFIGIIPRMISDSLLIGTSFTSRDQLRNHAYTLLADILHHVRMNLPYKILTHIYFIAIRNLHDPLLLPYVQTMYGKLMMNFVEPLLNCEKDDGQNAQEQVREILICAIDAYMRKAVFLAEYHLPLLREKYRAGGSGGGFGAISAPPKTTTTSNTQTAAVLSVNGAEKGSNDSSTGEASSSAVPPPSDHQRPGSDSKPVGSQTVEGSDRNASSENTPALKPSLREEAPAQNNSASVNDANVDQPSTSAASTAISIRPTEVSSKKPVAAGTGEYVPQSWQDITPLSLNDCKNTIRFIILPIKLMVSKLREIGNDSGTVRREIELLSKFFVNGLKCLDIFMFGSNSNGSYQKSMGVSNVRSKEEKEAVDAFISIYSNLEPSLFYEIMNEHIEFFVERISNSVALQSICSTILIHHPAGPKIGGVLVKYLLKRLPEMGTSNEKAILYLKLFKLVFSAVTYAQVNPDCENMLKPFLHDIVQESMKLALRSRESNNYFWLLRALFRSIGSGAHDLLYQQFLPLLPSILQQLNRLQNSSHRQSIHELFVELCLTVPVRLSSLLPYLPLLMDPLVCALYGTSNLVQQGLRTLELCVDNLQPEYFYDHMFPVRAPLLQGLWQTVDISDYQTALSAFRILGKFGGSSRKVLLDARAIDFEDADADGTIPAVFQVVLHRESKFKAEIHSEKVDENAESSDGFNENNGLNGNVPFYCDISLQELVDGAAAVLRLPQNNDPSSANVIGVNSMGYGGPGAGIPRIQALEIVKSVLLSAIHSRKLSEMNPDLLKKYFAKAIEKAQNRILEERLPNVPSSDRFNQHIFLPEFKKARKLYSSAFVGLFYAVVNNELKAQSFSLFKDVIRYFTVQAILEFGNEEENDAGASLHSLTVIVLVDALTTALADSCKDFCHAVVAALKFMIDTAKVVFGGEKVCELPFFDYLMEQLSLLCYRKEWYARLGGCTALRFIVEHYPKNFVRKHAAIFLNGFSEITTGLADEVSFGALDYASMSIDVLLPICLSGNENEGCDNSSSREEMIQLFMAFVVESLHDSEPLVRKEAHRILTSMSLHTEESISQLLQRCKLRIVEILAQYMGNFIKLSVDCQTACIGFYSFVAELADLILDIPQLILHSFIRNLLIIADVSKENLLAQSKYTSGDLASLTNGSKKYLAIRTLAIGALVVWCSQNLRSDELSPSNSEEEVTNDLTKQTFTLLLESALTSSMGPELREECATGFKKISLKNPSACAEFIKEKISLILHDIIENNESKLTKDALKNLIFLNDAISYEFPHEYFQILTNGVQSILSTDPSLLSLDDVECFFYIFRLFCRMSFKSCDTFKSCFTFLVQTDDKFLYLQNSDWMEVFVNFTCLNAEDGAAHFLITETSAVDDCSSHIISKFTVALLGHKNSRRLREAIMRESQLLIQTFELFAEEKHQNIETESNFLLSQSATKLLLLLRIVWQLAESEPTWFAKQVELFTVIRRLWNSATFRNVFSVRKEMDDVCQSAELMETSKYEVPVYCARIMLAYLRILLSDNDDAGSGDGITTIDLVYDLAYVFCYTFVSDFSFLRNFIDVELIPCVSLEWRRNAFKKVIIILKSLEETHRSTGTVKLCEDQLVRFMQYVVSPVFHFAFEKFDADAVMGSAPDAEGDGNIMALLITYIEMICQQNRDSSGANKTNRDNKSNCMSDAMTIVMYQFCVLLVQNCPFHIHDMSKKQQESTRLRLFMLFGWPCLQANYARDLTEKYAGHLLIANIIDKFAIHRKIVLQVLNSLVMAHHQDHKEVVRKALDILVPAVPRRMGDGHIQLFTIIKKVIVEESRSATQVAVHCLNIVIRHHKVFYYVRHQLSHLILTTLQRLLSSQYGFESRRLVIDICDMFIKWEQERQKFIACFEATTTAGNTTIKTSTSQNNLVEMGDERSVPNSQAGDHGPITIATMSDPNLPSSSSSPNTTDNVAIASKNSAVDDLHRPMEKSVIDEVIYLLVKTATASLEMLSGNMSNSNHEQISKKSILLLRVAMKPTIFGNVATLKHQWFEKQLTFPNPEQFANEQASNHQLAQVHVALDFLSNIIGYMPQQVVNDLFRPLQRPLIYCLSCSSPQIVRSTYTVIGRLLEKTNSTSYGLVEFEMLNQFIAKYVHDSFSSYFSSLSNTAQPTLLAITLLRIIYGVQPAYLETVCLSPFFKMLQRLVRDYQSPNYASTGTTSSKPPESTQKFLGEALCICLEILCPRTQNLVFESKRTIAQLILVPLIEKGATDKVLEALIKVVHELVVDSGENSPPPPFIDGHSNNNNVNVGGGGIVNLGVGLLIRMCMSLEARLLGNADLLKMFLESVLFVFESERFTNLSDITAKLNVAFFWGLACSDHQIRSRCFGVLEKYFPADIFRRMLYILTKQNWQAFGNYFWISHVIHLMLVANSSMDTVRTPDEAESLPRFIEQKLLLKNCITFAEFTEQVIDGVEKLAEGSSTLAATNTDESSMEVEVITSNLSNATAVENMEPTTSNTQIKLEDDEEAMDTESSSHTNDAQCTKIGEDSEIKGESENVDCVDKSQLEANKIELAKLQDYSYNQNGGDMGNAMNAVFESYSKLLQTAKGNSPSAVIDNIVDFIHYDWRIAKKIFVPLFCSFWSQLNDAERLDLGRFAQPFLASTIMLPQRESPLSVAGVFLEAFSTCQPPVLFTPPILSYIAETHNYWHFVIRLLEKEAATIRLNNDPAMKNAHNQPVEKLEVLEHLAHLYSNLNENDQFWMVWKRKCYFDKTAKCLALFNQGEFTQVRDLLEKLMNHLNERVSRPPSRDNTTTTFGITPALHSEVRLWEEYWVNSCKELNDWSTLAQFANSTDIADCNLLMESSWHLNQWRLLGDCITQVDACADPKFYVKSSLFKSMITITNAEPGHKEVVEKSLLDINKFLITNWRRLPKVVSMSHVGLLVDAHLVHEVSEASSTLPALNNNSSTMNVNNNNVKHVMKSWRSRPLTQVDSLSSWINIFTWRFQHYSSIINDQQAQQQSTFLLHSLAQSQLNLALSLRRSNQVEMALNELNTLHTLPSVLPMDAQMKIYEQVKCFIKLANGNGTVLKQAPQDLLYKAMDVIENTQLQFLKKDQISRLMLTKGILLSKLNQREDASKAFATAATFEDKTAGNNNTSLFWKHWGRHLENLFLANSIESDALNYGIQALVSFLECAKSTSQVKSRSHLARVFWLLKMIASIGSVQCKESLEEALNNNLQAIPSSNWLFWLNEIVADIRQRPTTSAMSELLCSLAEAHPQQVFYVLRVNLEPLEINERLKQLSDKIPTFFEWNALTLRSEIGGENGNAKNGQNFYNTNSPMNVVGTDQFESGGEHLTPETAPNLPNAVAPAWREKFLSAVDALFLRQPANILRLNEILNELDNFKHTLLESVLYQLRELLNICNDQEFSNISGLSEKKLQKDLFQKITKFVECLDQSIESLNQSTDKNLHSLLCAIRNSLSKELCENTKYLHRMASSLRKSLCVVVERMRTETENKQLFLRDTSKVLGNFKNKMALIDICSGHICPRISTHTAQIAHFMSTYYCFARQNGVRRLILVRSLNGKIYSYFLEKAESDPVNEYVLQLFTMLNTQFTKDRGMCQRLMQLAIPRVLPISRQSRLTECCPMAGISPQFRGHCTSAAGGTDSADMLTTQSFSSFIDIFDQMLKAQHVNSRNCPSGSATDVIMSGDNIVVWPENSWSESLGVVDHYYSRLVEQRFCHKTLLDIYNEISRITTNNTTKEIYVPKNLLERWISAKYADPSNYWMVRRNLSVAFALLGLTEYVLFLSPLNLSELYLDLSSTQLFYGGYRVDVSKKKCETASSEISISIELDANRPVALRMSSNISHFLDLSIEGHVSGALIAAAKCFNNISMEYLIRPMIWDIFYETAQDGLWQSTNGDHEDSLRNVINPVRQAVDTIVSRIKNISQFEGGNSPTTALLVFSQHADNLCRMDPNWHPWF